MHWLDWILLVLYALGVVSLGLWAGRRERNVEEYFLAGRSMPWVAVCVSILATAASALTFIGVPGAAFGGDFHYLQLGFGDLVGRVLIAWLLLSAYYRHKVATVYQLLGIRFGPGSRLAGTLFFITTRILASAVRLAGCAIAVSVFFNLSLRSAILLIALIALIYTVAGGIKAVIWTDALQFGLFVGGALLVLGHIWSHLPEGLSQFLEVGQAHGKFQIFRFNLDFNDPSSFLVGSLFGCFLTFAALGTDQDLVQRMLTCKKVKQSQKAIVLSGLLNFPLTLLFLSVGAALFAYYQAFPDSAVSDLAAQGRIDYIFPHFISTVLPAGLRGLLVAGLLAAAMSSLDSALNALASTVYVDLWEPYFRRGQWGAKGGVQLSRWLVVGFGILLALVAMGFGPRPSILWFGLRIMGYTYGALLGVFLLAVLTKGRGSDTGNVVAMLSSVAMVLFLTAELDAGLLSAVRTLLLSPLGISKVAWPWAVVFGTFWTFGLGALCPTRGRVKN